MFRNSSRLIAACLSLALVLSLASGCNALDFAPLVTATTTISEEFKTSSSPKLVIETFNGSIDISEGEGDEVVVEVTKRAGGFDREAAEANLDRVEVQIVQKDENTIHVTAKRLGRPIGNCGASVVVAAPKMARLQLKSSNGHIVCEAMQGGIDATTSNAKIDVVEGSGAIDVTTSNGGIDIEATAATVDARSSNAGVKFAGSLTGKENEFKSSNGKIELILPAESQFRLNASTSNAKIQCDFSLEKKEKSSRRKLAGTVGDKPEFSVSASTSNAGIAIRKAEAKSQ
jgi:DUF4097 and DUF4098 domain-containing protein YvlB